MPEKTYDLALTKAQAELLYDAVRTELEESVRYISRLEAGIRVNRDAANLFPDRYGLTSNQKVVHFTTLIRNATAGRDALKGLSLRLKRIMDTPEED